MDTKGAGWLECSFKISVEEFEKILGDTDLTKPLERAAMSRDPENKQLLLSLAVEWMLRSDPRRILNASIDHYFDVGGKVRASPSYSCVQFGRDFESKHSQVREEHIREAMQDDSSIDAFTLSRRRK